MRDTSIETEWLQTNPNLVSWPTQDLIWFVATSEGAGPTLRFPDAAFQLLLAFTEPRPAQSVVGEGSLDQLRSVLSDLNAHNVLLRVRAGEPPVSLTSHSIAWSGFRFGDLGIADKNIELQPARIHCIGGRELRVLDDVLEDAWIRAVDRWFFHLPFRKIDVDNPDTAHSRHWLNTFRPAQRFAECVPLFRRLAAIARTATGQPQAILRRIDAYNASYGDLPLPHRDVDEDRGLTVVLYGNSQWRRDWMGETVFYDDHEDPTAIVAPRPGRTIVFDGSILHRAGAPSRECHESRYTLVLRFVIP